MADDPKPPPTSVPAPASPTPPAASGVDETLPAASSQPARAKAAPAELPVIAPQSYTVDGEFARGGLGRILRARDERLGRPVALKELIRDSGDASARFVREALVTARLQHPAIVPVYEAGRWPSGAPFYAMKLVSGRSLDAVLREAKTLETRLALLPAVTAVCDAMAYAHSEKIIHRDLKPANVLAGSFGETVVIDWGLAKDLAAGGDEISAPPTQPDAPSASSSQGATVQGSIMGTPAYMPPEQALGEPVDERADVYALGAMLYQVLCGAAPYGGRTAEEVVSRVLAGPPRPLEEREPDLPPDLCAIVARAMARERKDRYPTARELAEDLRRFQTGQLVSVHRYSFGLLVRRFVRRNRAAVAVASVLLVVLAAFATVSVTRIVREKSRADHERAVADERRRDAEAQRAEAQHARRQADARSDLLILAQARMAVERDPATAVAWLKHYSSDAPGWGLARILVASASELGIARQVLGGHEGYVSLLEFSPDGKLVASGGYDGSVRLTTLATGEARVLPGSEPLEGLGFGGDGETLLTVTSAHVRRFDVPSGAVREIPLAASGAGLARMVALAPGDRLAAIALADHTIALVDLESGTRRVLTGHRDQINQVAFSPDGRTLASAGDDRAVWLWDVASGTARALRGHGGPVTGVGFSPDGTTVVSSCADRTVRLWDLERGALRAQAATEDLIIGTGYAAAGDQIASACVNGTIHIWDARLAGERVLRGHGGAVNNWLFAGGGKRLISAGGDGLIRVWDLASGESRALRGHGAAVFALALDGSGTTLASGDAAGQVRLWDISPRGPRTFAAAPDEPSPPLIAASAERVVWSKEDGRLRSLDPASGEGRVVGETLDGATAVALSPGAGAALLVTPAGLLRLVDLTTGLGRDLPAAGEHAITAAFSPGGSSVAAAGYEGEPVRLWDLASGASRALGVPPGRVTGLVFSPRGERLAAYGWSPDIVVWDTRTGEARALRGHEKDVRHVAFSPSGDALASAGKDGSVRLWELASGGSRVLGNHRGEVNHVAFSPGGDRVASAGDDKAVRVFDLAATGEAAARAFTAHGNGVTFVAFSPGGERLASASVDSFARLWDLGSGESRVLAGHPQTVWSLAFSADGTRLVTAGGDGSVRVFTDDLPFDPPALLERIEQATHHQVEERGR